MADERENLGHLRRSGRDFRVAVFVVGLLTFGPVTADRALAGQPSMPVSHLHPVFLGSNDHVSRYGGTDNDWNRAIGETCPSLVSGCTPPRWARNAHMQNALTVWRDRVAETPAWDREQRLVVAGGGTVSIQWLGLEEPPETPVLVVLHTICGSGEGLARMLSSLRGRLGWVVAACNRRGHAGLPLTSPEINTMGSTADLRLQLAAIEARRPGAALYGVGVSAGSGLLVRYLGEEGDSSRLSAGVAVCPAYDISEAFHEVHPGYDAYLSRRLVSFFLRRNAETLGAVEGFAACAASKSMAEFHDRLWPLAGYGSREAFYAGSNPMVVASSATTPMLVINAADDPVCVERNVHRHLGRLQELPRLTLALTRHGSHCGFFEGDRARGSWANRAIAEYLRAADALLHPSCAPFR